MALRALRFAVPSGSTAPISAKALVVAAADAPVTVVSLPRVAGPSAAGDPSAAVPLSQLQAAVAEAQGETGPDGAQGAPYVFSNPATKFTEANINVGPLGGSAQVILTFYYDFGQERLMVLRFNGTSNTAEGDGTFRAGTPFVISNLPAGVNSTNSTVNMAVNNGQNLRFQTPFMTGVVINVPYLYNPPASATNWDWDFTLYVLTKTA
jgi:hypothetical protein